MKRITTAWGRDAAPLFPDTVRSILLGCLHSGVVAIHIINWHLRGTECQAIYCSSRCIILRSVCTSGGTKALVRKPHLQDVARRPVLLAASYWSTLQDLVIVHLKVCQSGDGGQRYDVLTNV
jgi:hypothetical protein